MPRPHELDLQRYTGRTVVAVGTLTEHLAVGPAPRAGRRSWGSTGRASAGSPHRVRTGGGLVVGALGVEGPVGGAVQRRRDTAPRLVEQLLNAAREISAGLEVAR